ncbi:MAG: type II toxin-antitoxin system RelE family toxin [Frankia sp.]
MTYTVSLAPRAFRQLRTLDPTARRRIQAVIELLAADPVPRPPDRW